MPRDLYHEITEEIDAREILRYLNDLGIRNISGEVLKDFISDLKRVIKYDLYEKTSKENLDIHDDLRGPARLHSASTFSSRSKAKINQNSILKCMKGCNRDQCSNGIKNVHSAPILNHNENITSTRRTCSCSKILKKPDSETVIPTRRTILSSNNLIKIPMQVVKKKSDPVSLYHYYLSMWEKYKDNVPGENKWADLRWSIRQKLAGDIRKPTKKLVTLTVTDREKREKEWVD